MFESFYPSTLVILTSHCQNHLPQLFLLTSRIYPIDSECSNLGVFTYFSYEDAFNRFIDEINSIAAYDWWEGSIHSILFVLAYPCAWSWKQWRRRIKIQRLQEYVKSEYDHSCLRSCRARALYKGMKVFNYVTFEIYIHFCSKQTFCDETLKVI